MYINNLNLDGVVSLEDWNPRDYKLRPYHKAWTSRIQELVRIIVDKDNMFNPYTDADIHTMMTYCYGLRGVSLDIVEKYRAEKSIPDAKERRKQYMERLRSLFAAKETEYLESSGDSLEELYLGALANFDDLVVWKNVEILMRPILASGVGSFDKRYARRTIGRYVGDDKDKAVVEALNFCVKQKFLAKKGDTYTVTSKAKAYANFQGLEYREPKSDTNDAQGATQGQGGKQLRYDGTPIPVDTGAGTGW